MTFDLKTQSLAGSFTPATGVLFGANGQSDAQPEVYQGTTVFAGFLGTVNNYTAQQYFGEAALTDGATINWNLNTQQVAGVTIAGNRTIANPTNMQAGSTYRLRVTQDATGGRTLTWGTAYKWLNNGGNPPTLSTTAGVSDFIDFECDGAFLYGSAGTHDGSSAIVVGGTPVSGGTSSRVLYDNGGTLGELATTGSGNVVLATSPTLVTPALGVATATSINKTAITAPTSGSTLTIADGKAFTVSNSVTLTGTDSSSYNLDHLATDAIEFVIDGGGSTITTGMKGYLEVPYACTINRATLLADQSGSIVVDVFKCTYAQFDAGSTHPVSGDKITASAPPTISSATKAQDSTLTGWTTSISAGDILAFNVNSVTTLTRVTLSLKVTKS